MLGDQKNDNVQLQKLNDDLKRENDLIRRDISKIIGQVKQKQEEMEKLIKLNSKLNQDNKDLSAFLERHKIESDRLGADYDRIKVI
jgi:hypothetical protein